jgi:hypothetical protein
MKDFALFNDTFDIVKTNTYHLNILLKPSGISYTIVDTLRRRCVAIKNFTFENLKDTYDYLDRIKDFLQQDTFLSRSYKTIDFVYSTRKSTIIPQELFDKKMLKSYFTFVHHLDEYEEIHFNRLNKVEAVNVFSIPSEITTLMVNQFPELKFSHQASTFIDNSITKSEITGYIIGVMAYKSYFDVAVCNNGKLLLYNNFDFHNEADFVYHISNIYQQLRISDAKTNLFLTGDIDKESQKYRLLNKYIRNVWFGKISDVSSIKYQFREVPEHYLTNLLNMAQ